MNKITVIGDVHGLGSEYTKLTDTHEYTVQIGDMGFDYQFMKYVDPEKHIFFGGNHDNYDKIGDCKNCVGDLGTYSLNGIDFFFLRGEHSVDRGYRSEGINWWRDEELEYQVLSRAVTMFEINKPNIVLSHGCPTSVLDKFITNGLEFKPSKTTQALEQMFQLHRPKIWIFGHHHKSHRCYKNGCLFICVDELDTVDITEYDGVLIADENVDHTR